MKIALVHDWLTGMRGGEKCLEVLCRRFPDARLYTLLHARGSTSPAIERMRIGTSFLQRLPGVSRHYRYMLPLMPMAVGGLKIPGDVEMVVSFSHAVAKSVKPPPGVPHVCYCFTPMRYAWHRREDYFAGSGRVRKTPLAAARNLMLDWIRRWDRATSDRVSHFVAISRTVAERIRQSYGRPSRIIHPPVDTRFHTPADVPREDYYVCVSALVPYKRIDLAVEACNRLGRRLVVIGEGPGKRQLAKLAGPTVTIAGWRGDEQIRDHFRRGRALLFPGNEDFGIVPVEAQACGMPVVAYAEGGATETVLPADATRPGSGLFFHHQTPESLCRAIQQFEAHPDRFDPKLARRQAQRFAAERFERELVGYIEEVASQGLASTGEQAEMLEKPSNRDIIGSDSEGEILMSTIARLSMAEYDCMIERGVFDQRSRRRLEFIRGEIREMVPIGSLHEDVLDRLTAWSFRSLPEAEVRIRVQESIGLPDVESAPEPDLAWVVRRDYSSGRPTAPDVLLVIEVAHSSLAYDRGEKADLYAAAGIADYWVINLLEHSIEVRRDPGSAGYRSLQTYSGEDEVHPLAFTEVTLRPSMLG